MRVTNSHKIIKTIFLFLYVSKETITEQLFIAECQKKQFSHLFLF